MLLGLLEQASPSVKKRRRATSRPLIGRRRIAAASGPLLSWSVVLGARCVKCRLGTLAFTADYRNYSACGASCTSYNVDQSNPTTDRGSFEHRSRALFHRSNPRTIGAPRRAWIHKIPRRAARRFRAANKPATLKRYDETCTACEKTDLSRFARDFAARNIWRKYPDLSAVLDGGAPRRRLPAPRATRYPPWNSTTFDQVCPVSKRASATRPPQAEGARWAFLCC